MESTPEQVAEGLVVVRVLGAVLERLVAANANLAKLDPGQVTKFHALKAPAIGISQYLERIHKYASCSTECFILALIYIDRLIQGNNFLLTELNVHRVAITSILLAAKFFDDAYYNNAYYAKVGGVLVSEMNRLEVEFLFRINFSLHVSPELYNKYHAELSAHAASEIPVSSPALFVRPADVSEPEHQVSMISCNHLQNNCPIPSQRNHPQAKLSENGVNFIPENKQVIGNCLVPTQQAYQNTKQYFPDNTIHITPSPPPTNSNHIDTNSYCNVPTTNNVPTNLIWQNKNTPNTRITDDTIAHSRHNKHGIRECNSMEEHRNFPVAHYNYTIPIQPKLLHPWAQAPDHQSASQNVGYNGFTNVSPRSKCARSVCRVSPSYANGTSSVYVEYAHYNEQTSEVLPHTHPPQMISHHNILDYPRRSTSTIPTGAFGYNRRSSLKW